MSSRPNSAKRARKETYNNWNAKRSSKNGKTTGLNDRKLNSTEKAELLDDEEHDERNQTSDATRCNGSFPLDVMKLSAEYSRKIDQSDMPKKKWAVNFGYLGSNYQGLQINPGADTIERYLEKALFLGNILYIYLSLTKYISLFIIYFYKFITSWWYCRMQLGGFTQNSVD